MDVIAKKTHLRILVLGCLETIDDLVENGNIVQIVSESSVKKSYKHVIFYPKINTLAHVYHFDIIFAHGQPFSEHLWSMIAPGGALVVTDPGSYPSTRLDQRHVVVREVPSVPRSVTTPESKTIIHGKPRKRTFGILCYKNSTNIGDYGQSLAQINILSRFYRPSWHIESVALREAFEWLSRTKPSGPNVRQRNYDTDVTVIWVDRDSTRSAPHNNQVVYMICNGWYMHPDKKGVLQWPFAEWVRPFLVSMHIANEKVLQQPHAVSYMNKYGPVGARDLDTLKLLQKYGINSFFSGCLTWTLESPELAQITKRTTCFKNDILREFVEEGDICISHTMPAMKSQDPDMHLRTAVQLYKNYAQSKSIQSTRIHTVMPALALGAENVWFTSPSCGNDPSWNDRSRFSGLVSAMSDPERCNLRAFAVCERLTECIDRLLVNGVDDAFLLRVWRGQCGGSTYTSTPYDLSTVSLPCRWSSFRTMHHARIIDSVGGSVDRCSPLYFDRVERSDASVEYTFRTVPIHAFLSRLDIVVTFDTDFVHAVRPFLLNLARHNQDTFVRVFCCTRGVDKQIYDKVLQSVTDIANVVLFCIPMSYVFDKYSSPLHHVSVSCMDRLLIPRIDFPVDDSVTRVIYMDLDMLVHGDLTQLNAMCTGRCGILAKNSKRPRLINEWLKHNKCRPVFHGQNSFNFGLAVMDLHKLRYLNFTARCLQFHTDLAGANDQIAANMFCAGAHTPLPGQFNVFVGQDDDEYTLTPGLSNTGVVFHFVGAEKPWLYTDQTYPHNKEFWKLIQTSQ